MWVMSKFFNQLNNIKVGRAKVRAYGEGGTVDALESARDYLREKYNDPEAGIPTKVATVLGLVPVNLARSAARAVTAPARSMTDENFNPEEEAANMAGFVTTGGIGLSKAGLGPKGDVLGMGVGPQPMRNIVHENPFSVGTPKDGHHITEKGYTYRSVSPKEISHIIETGEAIPNLSGKSKGGQKNAKHWARGNGILHYRPDQDVIRIKNGSLLENSTAKISNIEVWDSSTNTFKLLKARGGAVHQRALGAKLFGLK